MYSNIKEIQRDTMIDFAESTGKVRRPKEQQDMLDKLRNSDLDYREELTKKLKLDK